MKKIKFYILIACTALPSWLRLTIWRMIGMRVGRGCRVSILTVVVADSIELGNGAIIEAFTLIYHPKVFRMGERARIASFVRIIGYRGEVDIRRQSFIGLSCLIDSSGNFFLGERSQVGPRTTIYTHGTSGLTFSMRFPERIGPVTIGRDCYIGMGCLVHPDVTIGNEVLVFPGMTIRRSVNDKVAIVPPSENEFLTQPLRRLQVLTPTRWLHEKIEKTLRCLALEFNDASLDDSRKEYWVVELSGGKKIFLLTSGSALPDLSEPEPNRAVIWTLEKLEGYPSIPQFCFEDLTVYGPFSPFAEMIANWLTTNTAQFAFAIDSE